MRGDDDDERFREFFVRNRPRAFWLLMLLVALIAWLNVPGRPDF